MDYSSKNKTTLRALVEYLEIDVEAKKKNKPTIDELVVALEAYEDQEAVAEAYKSLGFEEDEPVEDSEDEEDSDEDTEEEVEVKGKGTVFTYVGKGETSPQRINFMGKQEFIRGRPVTVTDPKLIAKLKGNPTFIIGKANPELLQEIEDEGMAVAEANRKADKAMDAQFKKKHGGTGKDE